MRPVIASMVRALYWFLVRDAIVLTPPWARDMLGLRLPNRGTRLLLRVVTRLDLAGARLVVGAPPEARQARIRATATPVEPATA